MHQAAYRALGLDWHYVPFEIEEPALGAALAAIRTLRIRGVGVSMPFKLEVARRCDRLDDVARRIGAVNTLVNDGGALVGHNTDWLGAVRALEEASTLEGRRVIVLGAGGAARAVAFGLLERNASVVLCNRTEARAARLAEDLGLTTIPWERRDDLATFDVVVNASSLGMTTIDAASPLSPRAFREGLVVMDIVYKPVETQLVRAARREGAKVIHGARMLLHQAAAQFELYTGRTAPLEAMASALEAQLG
ncbi:MAG: shikimate dehydrogenase [Deltaproteobacteria bacterium]|nr:shikimate dehydrogenase [Deltaproteobacteria bacterium]